MKHIKNFEEFLNEGSWFDDNPKSGQLITDHTKYSQNDLLKVAKKLNAIYGRLESFDLDIYDGTIEINIEDQSYYYGYSDDKDCWTGSYHVDGELQVIIPMNIDEFLVYVKDAIAHLGLNEGSSSGYETAFGEDIIKDKKLFTHVINVLLDYVKNWESSDSVTKRKLEKWLKVYALENDDFDFLENLEHTMDGFFEYYDPTVINEGSSPLLTVYLDKGLKMTYSAQDLMTYIKDFNVREDDLPRWLYQATIKHSNYSYENPNVVMKSQFPKLVRMDTKNIRLLLELIVDYIINIDNITKKLNKSRENVEINISRDQTPASWYIAPKWVANNTFLHESVEEINEGYETAFGEDIIKGPTVLESSKKYKGYEVYPDWIDPKRDFGNPVKSVYDLKPGAEYILWEPGMETWQAEYIYQGHTGGNHIFNPLSQNAIGGEAMVFTDYELAEYIKDGYIIKQN